MDPTRLPHQSHVLSSFGAFTPPMILKTRPSRNHAVEAGSARLRRAGFGVPPNPLSPIFSVTIRCIGRSGHEVVPRAVVAVPATTLVPDSARTKRCGPIQTTKVFGETPNTARQRRVLPAPAASFRLRIHLRFWLPLVSGTFRATPRRIS